MSPERSRVEVGDLEARYYDFFLSLLSLGFYPQFIKEVVENMDIRLGQSILDLGSGTGKNDLFMAQKIGAHGRIVGLDISDEMLGRAAKRFRKYPNVVFEKRRIELPMPYKEEFDKVFISFALHGFEDDKKVGIMQNAHQALKAGGSFYVLDYAEFDINRMWVPFRWAFTRWECQLASEFLKLDIKAMLYAQGFANVAEKLFLGGYLRLLSAVKAV